MHPTDIAIAAISPVHAKMQLFAPGSLIYGTLDIVLLPTHIRILAPWSRPFKQNPKAEAQDAVIPS